MANLMLGAHTRWAVLWVVQKPKKVKLKKGGYRVEKRPVVIEKDFEQDLNGAIELYTKVKTAGRDFPTLLSRNVGFPPPKKFMPYQVTKMRKQGRKKVPVQVTITPMAVVNRRGLIWCPYCREFRKFQLQDGFRVEGKYVPDRGWHCPICAISHRNVHVRRWNPQMVEEYYKLEMQPIRRRSATTRRTRRST